MKEAVENRSIHWLEPVTSFDMENKLDSQFDFLIIPKAFLFRSLVVIANVLDSDENVNKSLMEFYLKHAKPQYQTWISREITAIKFIRPIETESFVNVKFKTTRGSANSVFELSLIDPPCLNTFDWITLLHILITDEKKYEPIVAHIKRMLVSYIHEVAKMDIEITTVLRKKPTILPQGSANDIENTKMGKIETDNWTVMFQRG